MQSEGGGGAQRCQHLVGETVTSWELLGGVWIPEKAEQSWSEYWILNVGDIFSPERLLPTGPDR